MKRLILPLTLLITMVAAAPLFAVDNAQRPTLAMDVVRLVQAGVADSAIIAFVKSHHGTYTVSADDMILMSHANVSPEVMRIVADDAATRDSAPPPPRGQARSDAQAAPPADRDWREGGTLVEESPGTRVVVSAPRVFFDPWYYWDPFWYGPSLSLNLGWGYYGGYYPYYGHGRYYGYNGGHYGGGGGRPGGGHPGGGGGRPGGGHPGGGHPGGGNPGGGNPGGGGHFGGGHSGGGHTGGGGGRIGR